MLVVLLAERYVEEWPRVEGWRRQQTKLDDLSKADKGLGGVQAEEVRTRCLGSTVPSNEQLVPRPSGWMVEGHHRKREREGHLKQPRGKLDHLGHGIMRRSV